MMKKFLSLVLCGMMLFAFAGCSLLESTGSSGTMKPVESSTDSGSSTTGTGDSNKPNGTTGTNGTTGGNDQPAPTPDADPTTTLLHSETAGIKVLGERQYVNDEEQQINCDWTCSGIEFTLNSLGGNISFEADSDKPCYFRAYINGTEWKKGTNPYYTVNGETTVTLENVPEGELTVRFIKVSGHTLARAQLYSVTYYGTLSETAPADKNLYIEFVGDSISCGWGVVGKHDGTYSSQDGALAYPYMLSQRLNADYSVTALSGQGVVYHGTNIPNMYNGYLMASPLRNDVALYNFERKADVVVVNMGTNDYSNRATVTEESFAKTYKKMLETILQTNGEDCKIVCLYNTMNDTFADSIISVCYELGGNAAGIYTFEMERANSGHPTKEENEDYTDALEAFMESVLDGEILDGESNLESEAAGDGMSVDVSDFGPMPSDR